MIYRIAKRLEINLSKRIIKKKLDTPVVNIGLQKSGTTSFHTYMQWIGYKSIHCYPHLLSKGKWSSDCKESDLLGLENINFTVFKEFEVFSDTPFCNKEVYERIAETFDKVHFVYTFRSQENWVRSVLKHISQPYYTKQLQFRINNYKNFNENEDFLFTCNELGLIEFLYKKPLRKINEEFLKSFYDTHLAEVKKFSNDIIPVKFLNIEQDNVATEISSYLNIRKNYFIKFPHEKRTNH